MTVPHFSAEEYTCAMCGETFFKGWSHEEALEEMRFHFGDVPESEQATVCEDCWLKIHPARN